MRGAGTSATRMQSGFSARAAAGETPVHSRSSLDRRAPVGKMNLKIPEAYRGHLRMGRGVNRKAQGLYC